MRNLVCGFSCLHHTLASLTERQAVDIGGRPCVAARLWQATWRLAPQAAVHVCCPQVRRMYVLLPGALGKDQPGAVATVLAHFHATQGWNFHTMTQVWLS